MVASKSTVSNAKAPAKPLGPRSAITGKAGYANREIHSKRPLENKLALAPNGSARASALLILDPARPAAS